MKLSEFSVKNSLVLDVIAVFLVIAGIIGIVQLKREAFPTIDFDAVLVQTIYPGSTPQEIEKLITIPIEDELKSVDDIDSIDSTSSEGISIIGIKIDQDAVNKDKVINDIQRAVDRVEDFPDDLEDRPIVKELSTKNQPTITVSIAGDIDESKLQDYARNLETELLDIPGVGKITRSGWRDREIHVEMNLQTMAKEYISLSEVIQALKSHNVSIPGGTFYDETNEYILRTSGEFYTAKEIANVVVRSNTDGRQILVKDVAKVVDTFKEERIIHKTKGKRAINLTVIRKASGDTIDIVDQVRQILDHYQTLSHDIDVSYFNDISYYIKRRINVLSNNGWLGMALVVLCLFTFLSFRVAFGACIGIPISLLTTFAIMYWSGISINLLSMFGLIMVLGMLVDEDIVISENIYRHLEEGYSPERACIEGSTEVSRAVIATVSTTLAAFLPLYLMSGIMGKFVKNIPQIVTITLVASLSVAIVMLPSHLFHLTRHLQRDSSKPKVKNKAFFLRLRNFYESMLCKALKYKYRFTLLLCLLLIVSLADAVLHMKLILFPTKGIEIFHIRTEGESGQQLADTERNIKGLENLILKLPKEELDNFITDVGYIQEDNEGARTDRGSHIGQIVVYLTPEQNRKRTSTEIVESLREQAIKLPGFKTISFEEAKGGPPIGKPIDLKVKGNDLEKLKELSVELANFIKNIEGVTDIKNDSEQFMDTLLIDIDPAKAAQAELNVRDIALAVRSAFEGTTATSIKNTDEEINVVVKLPYESRYKKDDLINLLIKNKRNNLIPLNRVAQIKNDVSLRYIKHDDGMRAMTITANVNEKVTTSFKANSVIKKAYGDFTLKHPGYTLSFGGEQEDTQESLTSLLNALYIAIGLIFIILVAMFRSISFPLLILFTIPFSVIGVVIAFEVHQLPISFMVLLGMVGLTGVVANSAIIVIDFIQKARERGMSQQESILQGALLRFRPVLLTSLTTALGVIPAAYGLGGLDPFIQPMALTLNYGLIFGALLSLFFVPCLVAILDDLKTFVGYKGRQTAGEVIQTKSTEI